MRSLASERYLQKAIQIQLVFSPLFKSKKNQQRPLGGTSFKVRVTVARVGGAAACTKDSEEKLSHLL